MQSLHSHSDPLLIQPQFTTLHNSATVSTGAHVSTSPIWEGIDLAPYPVSSIVRIYLRNFMAYEEQYFFPGPKLNLILGPNGSGKSTILCALILGFGGSPQDLPRQKTISEFIRNSEQRETEAPRQKKNQKGPDDPTQPSEDQPQALEPSEPTPLLATPTPAPSVQGEDGKKIRSSHSKQTATIELAVVVPDATKNKSVILISRQIDTADCSIWKLNNKRTTEKNVTQIIAKLRIHPNRLTQFLPQERISTLAATDPAHLLQETQQSLLPIDAIEAYNELIQNHNRRIEILTFEVTVKKQLETLQEMNRSILPSVERHKATLKRRERIYYLEKKRFWLVYMDRKNECKELEKSISDLEALVNEKKMVEMTKIVEDVEQLKKHKDKLQSELQTQNRKYESQLDQVRELDTKISKIKDDIEDTKEKEKERQAHLKQRLVEKKKLMDRLKEEERLAEESTEKMLQIDTQIAEAKAHNDEVENQIMLVQNERNNLNLESYRIKQRSYQIQDLIQREETRRSTVRSKLATKFPNIHQVNNILQQQRKRRMFKEDILGPVAVELIVQDEGDEYNTSSSKTPRRTTASLNRFFVEHCIGTTILRSFVGLNEDDKNSFYEILREQHTKASLLRINDKMPIGQSGMPMDAQSQAQFRRYGIIGMLSSKIACAPAIRVTLEQMCGINRIAIATEQFHETSSQFFSQDASSPFNTHKISRVCTPSRIMTANRSFYDQSNIIVTAEYPRSPNYLVSSPWPVANSQLQNIIPKSGDPHRDQKMTANLTAVPDNYFESFYDNLRHLPIPMDAPLNQPNFLQQLQQECQNDSDGISRSLDEQEARLSEFKGSQGQFITDLNAMLISKKQLQRFQTQPRQTIRQLKLIETEENDDRLRIKKRLQKERAAKLLEEKAAAAGKTEENNAEDDEGSEEDLGLPVVHKRKRGRPPKVDNERKRLFGIKRAFQQKTEEDPLVTIKKEKEEIIAAQEKEEIDVYAQPDAVSVGVKRKIAQLEQTRIELRDQLKKLQKSTEGQMKQLQTHSEAVKDAQDHIKEKEQMRERLRKEINNLEHQLVQTRASFEDAQQRANAALKTAEQEAPQTDEKMVEMMRALPSQLPLLDAELGALRSAAEMGQADRLAEQKAMEFEDREKEITKQIDVVNQAERDSFEMKLQTNILYTRWIRPLRTSVAKLSDAFESNMKKLGKKGKILIGKVRKDGIIQDEQESRKRRNEKLAEAKEKENEQEKTKSSQPKKNTTSEEPAMIKDESDVLPNPMEEPETVKKPAEPQSHRKKEKRMQLFDSEDDSVSDYQESESDEEFMPNKETRKTQRHTQKPRSETHLTPFKFNPNNPLLASININQDDLEEYDFSEKEKDKLGLIIMVCFVPSVSAQLEPLCLGRQSGGEKSVSLMLFLLALQTIANQKMDEHDPKQAIENTAEDVPQPLDDEQPTFFDEVQFPDLIPHPLYVVDEINQGMDTINERKVMSILFESTQMPNSPQSFVITPKLLHGLAFSRGTRFMIPFDGPFVLSQTTLHRQLELLVKQSVTVAWRVDKRRREQDSHSRSNDDPSLPEDSEEHDGEIVPVVKKKRTEHTEPLQSARSFFSSLVSSRKTLSDSSRSSKSGSQNQSTANLTFTSIFTRTTQQQISRLTHMALEDTVRVKNEPDEIKKVE
ncbi:putative Structural maintenance of chromosomes protein 5 [Blattamonas nauphoetae]|uniref:Structural maintenance of chromosomes protein 5 n=1 Tax=Blattamonas nauphoetae TaxID=2049346 RepID=A0ABQ9YEG9_9EUKA|nr:putative Structural maintenance of chromosomes protein 5 [Blattamonas nauphoetae]